MRIHGLQKMTLLDYPEHVACTVFLGGCDFRCPYCHNYELVENEVPPLMEEEEFFAFLGKRKGLLDGVAITGGEPLLRKDIEDFIKKIKEMGFLVKLDTNGNHPDMLEKLMDSNLVDYIAMDIKNSPEKYGLTIGIKNFDVKNIDRSISLLLTGKIPYEFRTTVVKEFHTSEDFISIGRWIRNAKAYYLQQYVERDTVPDKSLHSPESLDMENYLQTVKPYVSDSYIRGVD